MLTHVNMVLKHPKIMLTHVNMVKRPKIMLTHVDMVKPLNVLKLTNCLFH